MEDKYAIRLEEMEAAGEKFRLVGPLGVTAEDHRRLGSTPNSELAQNPGKRLIDLMDEARLLAWLRDQQSSIVEFRAKAKESSFAASAAEIFERDLVITIAFLRAEGRLPAAFKE